jgi:uncharacterized membrane protein YhhN
MYIWLAVAFIFAALDIIAVSKNLQRLEYVAKPAVLVCLFLWLVVSTGLQGNRLWFGLALLFSLAGDVLLMFSLTRENLFIFGLGAFLLAHLAYITGFRDALKIVNGWSLLLLIIIAINASRLIRRVVGAIRAKGEKRLVIPAAFYGAIVSFMLFVSMSTLYDPAWKAGAALLVSAGAFLFWISDVILAWNKFVSPIKNGRAINIAAYFLGQIGLVAGILSQFK